jgi:hypothetical protein
MQRNRPPQEQRHAQREMEEAVKRGQLAEAQKAQRQLELLRAERAAEFNRKK